MNEVELQKIVNRLNNIERFLFDALIVINHLKDEIGLEKEEE